MVAVNWQQQINFASALLLHSCLTVLVKEFCNAVCLLYRASRSGKAKYGRENTKASIRASAVLDAYTSVFSNDADGELAELYFTNIGALLLGATLASSVAMNLYLSDQVLNGLIVGTFGFCFVASLAVGRGRYTILIVALRRAGKLIWADTPFVNFFSLIYIATALRGSPMLRVKDYIAFRSIAVFELLFMKAKLAASSPDQQQHLMRQLISSEKIVMSAAVLDSLSPDDIPELSREGVAAFQTYQRLSAMLFKTTIGHEHGCVSGAIGPCTFPLPDVGRSIMEPQKGLRICRPEDSVVVIADCQNLQPQTNRWSRILAHAHGVLLRRLGKVRVIYLILAPGQSPGVLPLRFHSNVSLVTGVHHTWLDAFPEQSRERQALAIAR